MKGLVSIVVTLATFAIVALVSLSSVADAHHGNGNRNGAGFRATPFRPFQGPVPTHHHHHGGGQNFNFQRGFGFGGHHGYGVPAQGFIPTYSYAYQPVYAAPVAPGYYAQPVAAPVVAAANYPAQAPPQPVAAAPVAAAPVYAAPAYAPAYAPSGCAALIPGATIVVPGRVGRGYRY